MAIVKFQATSGRVTLESPDRNMLRPGVYSWGKPKQLVFKDGICALNEDYPHEKELIDMARAFIANPMYREIVSLAKLKEILPVEDPKPFPKFDEASLTEIKSVYELTGGFDVEAALKRETGVWGKRRKTVISYLEGLLNVDRSSTAKTSSGTTVENVAVSDDGLSGDI